MIRRDVWHVPMPGRSASSRAALLGFVVLVAACGGGSDSNGAPGRDAGEELFTEAVLEGNPGCITCHSLEPETTLVGPAMAGVAARAATRQPGTPADDYFRTSILDPNAFVVPGFEADLMPRNWGEVLSSADIDALVAYLGSLD